jgi:hypothetical protein
MIDFQQVSTTYSIAICHIHQAILLVVFVAFIVTLYLPELSIKRKYQI